MALTRLGWDIIESGSSPRLVDFPWVTGKVRGGDHFVVLDYIARRWNAEVEKIIKAHSWAYAKRDVREAAGIPSEHSAAIALDFNAPKHPLHVAISKTFTPAQIKTIRQIMKDVQGAARWGGEWSRPDGMHVELMGGNILIGKVADLIRAGKLPEPGSVGDVKPAAPAKPKPLPKGYDPKVKAYQDRQIYYPGMLRDGVDGPMNKAHKKWVIELQTELNKWHSDLPKLIPDGDYAARTKARVRECMERNDTPRKGVYWLAGGRENDGIAGPIFCKSIKIRKHPSA